jgi:hypothetical protein
VHAFKARLSPIPKQKASRMLLPFLALAELKTTARKNSPVNLPKTTGGRQNLETRGVGAGLTSVSKTWPILPLLTGRTVGQSELNVLLYSVKVATGEGAAVDKKRRGAVDVQRHAIYVVGIDGRFRSGRGHANLE